jgi:hypothetical protein
MRNSGRKWWSVDAWIESSTKRKPPLLKESDDQDTLRLAVRLVLDNLGMIWRRG